jgi:hypothetical protein
MEIPIEILLIFAGGLALIITIVVVGYLRAKKRREALAAVAKQLGLSFTPAKDRRAVSRFQCLDELRKGSNRYLHNRMQGSYKGIPVDLFDYHYQITRNNGKNSSTRHYHFTIYTCTLPKTFPELRIYREGIFEKLIQFVGFEDIHFESAEFSKRYTVRSRNRKFAYDFVHPQVMEFLLRGPDLNIEVDGNLLALVTQGQSAPEVINTELERLCFLRREMPGYLFD